MNGFKKVSYFIVAVVTIDGFIARYPGHKVDWASKEDKKHLHKMEDKSDVLILGSKTFKLAKKNLEKRNCIVLTTKVQAVKIKSNKLVFLNTNSVDLNSFVKTKGYKKVCVLGGRTAYNYCLENGLVDEIFLTIEPIVFGKGIGLFDKSVRKKNFSLESVKKLNAKGSVLLHYKKTI